MTEPGSDAMRYVMAISAMTGGSLTPEQIETDLPYARGLQMMIWWHETQGRRCYPASTSSRTAPHGFSAAMGLLDE